MPAEIAELISQITRQRHLEKEFVAEALADAIETALRKGKGSDYPLEVTVDSRRGDVLILVEKTVVEEVGDPDLEISLEEAREYTPNPEVGGKVKVPIPFENLGRGTVYKIQSLFLQKIREAERQHIYKDFQQRVGDLITGVIQKVDKTGVYVSLGRGEALLPPEEQIPGEKYKIEGMLRALILSVNEGRRRRPQIILSRTHPDFLRRLMEVEIPEIMDGTVEVKAVARIPGKRAKVAVRSKDPKIDPVGACIGMKGMRIQPLSKELFNERIDVIRWDPDIIKFAASAMSPTESILVFEDKNQIKVIVPDEKVPEAKGKEAQNVILASRLVGREIIIEPLSSFTPPDDAVTILELDIPENVRNILRSHSIYVFKEVPLLADLLDIPGIEEEIALKILEQIEEKLEEKKRNKDAK